MRSLFILLSSAPPKQPWFWTAADVVVGVLLFLNVLVFAAVHGRELRQRIRARRSERSRAYLRELWRELDSDRVDEAEVRRQVRHLNELERPIAAELLIERMRTASEEDRVRTLSVLREIGAIDLLLRSCRRRSPWRRALAIRTLGLLHADEAVQELIARVCDRSRYVREAAVRALGRIADRRALPSLAKLFAEPGRAAPGVVYEALVAFGRDAAHVFGDGLRSSNPDVRVASVFGVGAVVEPAACRRQLERMLADASAPVRAAAADVLGRIGGERVPQALADASRDEQRSVRRAAVSALAGYDDLESVRLAVSALDDRDRNTALRAGETLVRLSGLPKVGAESRAAIAASGEWPLETALVVASLEAQ